MGTKDLYRKELKMFLVCSKHPYNKLSMSIESQTSASSAYNIENNIVVHPCEICEREHQMFVESVELIIKVIDNNSISNERK